MPAATKTEIMKMTIRKKMRNLYVYDTKSYEVVAIITAITFTAAERKARELGFDIAGRAWKYAPGLGDACGFKGTNKNFLKIIV